MSEALKTNSTLSTLDLHYNSIGGNGAQALSEALKTNSTLTTLILWDNSIRDNGLGRCPNSTLTTLILQQTCMDPKEPRRSLKHSRLTRRWPLWTSDRYSK
ncbi:MAG: hypothetical protein JOS17DRAFT_752394 [Linnemannia elongata]|nr:MAG: hypothetical protein JOS17DRAFT_752394 [Linnemannia elongata]